MCVGVSDYCVSMCLCICARVIIYDAVCDGYVCVTLCT